MLRPDGTHLFVRGEFAALSLRQQFLKRGFFLGGQLNHRLIFSGELQENAGEVVLCFGGEAAHGFNGVFK